MNAYLAKKKYRKGAKIKVTTERLDGYHNKIFEISDIDYFTTDGGTFIVRIFVQNDITYFYDSEVEVVK